MLKTMATPEGSSSPNLYSENPRQLPLVLKVKLQSQGGALAGSPTRQKQLPVRAMPSPLGGAEAMIVSSMWWSREADL